MFAPQTNPASKSGFYVSKFNLENFFVVLIQGMHIPLPHPLFPVYRFFFPVAIVRKLWC
jgi:hypothetical protein